MTNSAPPPDRIEWRRDGYSVWADEDGVHLRTDKRGFEQPEALAMVNLYLAIHSQFEAGTPFTKPTAPPREKRTYYPDGYTVHRVKRAIDNAIAAELDPTDAPF